MPSTRQLAMPKPGPRADSRGSPVASATDVDTAYWLFSTKKQTGSFQAAARLKDYRVEQMFAAPSPK
jgi:hypothetical protein